MGNTLINAFMALEDIKEEEIAVTPKFLNKNKQKVNESKVSGNSKKIDESSNLKEEPVYDLQTQFDSRKSFYGKAVVDSKEDGSKVLYSYGTPVCRIEDGKATLLRKGYRGWSSSQTTLRHVKEFLKQNGFEVGSYKELAKMYPIEQARVNEALVNLSDAEQVEKAKELLDKEKTSEEEVIVDVDADTVDKLKDSYIGNAILRCPVCGTLIYKKPDALVKDEEKNLYNIEEVCPHCKAEDGFELVGQVAAPEAEKDLEVETSTGKEEVDNTEDEVKVEVEQETEEEPKRTTRIENLNDSEKKFVIEEVDEKRFDKLVNKYLSATYNNVESYSTTKIGVDDFENKIVLEGVIKYKSGKEKNTTFIFESKTVTKTGRHRFVGINETFTNSRNAFSLYGRITKDGNLKCESMRYSYNVKVLNESKIVKGKVGLLNLKTSD